MHVDKDLADLTVFIFTGVKIDLVAADSGLLDIALTTIRQLTANAIAFDDPLNNALADDGFRLRFCAAGCLAPWGFVFNIGQIEGQIGRCWRTAQRYRSEASTSRCRLETIGNGRSSR